MRRSEKNETTGTLPPGWIGPADEMLTVYRAAGLAPPSPDNFQAHFPRHVRVLSILDILVARGDLVRLGEGLYITAEAAEGVRATVRRLAGEAADGGVTVAAVRDATGSSRRIIVPLLEAMDKQGLTERRGDARYFKNP